MYGVSTACSLKETPCMASLRRVILTFYLIVYHTSIDDESLIEIFGREVEKHVDAQDEIVIPP